MTGQDEPEFTKRTLADDAQVVEDVLKRLVGDESKTVVLAMHSYGGDTSDSPDHDDWDGRFQLRNTWEKLYEELPDDEAAFWNNKVRPQSKGVMETVMTRCAYTYVPSTFVVATADKALPPPDQEMFAGLAGSDVKRIDSGHSVMLNRPHELMALLEEVAG